MRTVKEKQPVAANQRVIEFIQRHRKPICVAAVVVALGLTGAVIALAASEALRGRAIAVVEGFVVRHGELRDFARPPAEDAGTEDADAALADGGDAEGDEADDDLAGFLAAWEAEMAAEAAEREAELAELVEELRAFAARRPGYAGARAWFLLADLYGRKGMWAEAEAAWLSAAGRVPRSYMAPIAFFNAAAAAEEQGRAEEAIRLYEKSASARAGFHAAVRARFSIARILEDSLGDFPAALQAYRDLVAAWPNETEWVGKARSRIVALETMDARLDDPVTREGPTEAPAWGAPGFGGFDGFGGLDFGGLGGLQF